MATARHYAHLTLEMHREVENGVVEGRTLAWMAERFGVDTTSISADYERQWCGSTHRAPWVCSGCGRRPTCPLGHFSHSARVA